METTASQNALRLAGLPIPVTPQARGAQSRGGTTINHYQIAPSFNIERGASREEMHQVVLDELDRVLDEAGVPA